MKFSEIKYTPIDDRVLIAPGPVKYVNMIWTEPDYEANRDKKPDEIKEVKTKTKKVRTAYRIGKVLKTSLNTFIREDEIPLFKEGDWVVYREQQAIKFDLLAKRDEDPNCPVLLRRFEIVGIAEGVE